MRTDFFKFKAVSLSKQALNNLYFHVVILILILNERDIHYEDALKKLNLQTLDKRREKLCLSFAKKCLKNEKVKNFFPYNPCSKIRTRHNEIYKVNHANTERYKKSTIPYLQNMLNDEVKHKRNFLRCKGS